MMDQVRAHYSVLPHLKAERHNSPFGKIKGILIVQRVFIERFDISL
jgi:hypothetical protein